MTAPVEEDVPTLARPADSPHEPRAGSLEAVDENQDETLVRPWTDPLTLTVPATLRDSRSADEGSPPRKRAGRSGASGAGEEDDSVTAKSPPVESYDEDGETTQALAPPVSLSNRPSGASELPSHEDESVDNCTNVMPRTSPSEGRADSLARTLESAPPRVPSSVSGLATVRASAAPSSYASLGALMVGPSGAVVSTERGRPPETLGRSPLALLHDGENNADQPPRYGLLVALAAAVSLAVPMLLYLVLALRRPPELTPRAAPSVPERDVQTTQEPRAKAVSSVGAIRKSPAVPTKPGGALKR